jgi:hypothetical protein
MQITRRHRLASMLLGGLIVVACGGPPTIPTETCPAAGSVFATRIISWWLPECSEEQNRYVDPSAVLGPPDTPRTWASGNAGFMSLGRGGYVTVEMGLCAIDGPGPDLRVFQAVSGEPVTVYAAASAYGPFLLLADRAWCGNRLPGVFSGYCDFDLAAAGLTQARFLKVRDGERTPCRRAETDTEGADIDAVQLLHYSGEAM